MKILILGGTKFVGRHLVDAARSRQHTLTIFHRGKTNPNLFPDIQTLTGDRDGDLEALAGGTWDAVIDTSGYVPRIVRQSAELLRERTNRYLFISSISVYDHKRSGPLTEDSPQETLEDPNTEEIPPNYGGLKAACERVVQEIYGDQATIIRPGLIVGSHDHTGRFTYWPLRIADAGDIIAPGDPQQPVQFIDVRDLAQWSIRVLENEIHGVFNATGPAKTLSMKDYLESCASALGVRPNFVWASEEFLIAREVKPWMELPLWVQAQDSAMSKVDISRATSEGLTFRPLAETVRDTLEWARGVSDPAAIKMDGVGLDRSREAQLIEELTQTSS